MAETPPNRSLKENEAREAAGPAPGDDAASPFAPRLTDPTGETPNGPLEDSSTTLPPAKDLAKHRLAAADMVEFGISLDDAATHHRVDRDALHVFYRTYVNFVGKENVPDAHSSYASVDRGDFDRTSHRQFDRNWAEMMFEANRDRPPLSPTRRWLIRFPLTAWMFNGDVVDKVAVTGAACVIAFAALAFQLTRGASEPANQEPAVPATWEQGDDIDTLDSDEQIDLLDQILAALTTFIEAENWRDRLPQIRDREETEPLMERYYETHPDGPISPIVVEPDISFLARPDGRFALVQATRRRADADDEALIFLIEIAEDKFLFDWKVLVNYEPISWEKFKAERVTEDAPFRVKISPGDYYNHPFMDEEQFVSIRLTFLARPGEVVFGFCRRGTEVADAVQSLLDRDLQKNRAAILSLRFPEGAKFDNVVAIEAVLSDRW